LAQGALQFDVFPGYDSVLKAGAWFPITFEVFNDGPTFQGTIEFASDTAARGQARYLRLELPTNTRKRVSLSVFAGSGRATPWSARLLDERGITRAERPAIQFREQVWDSFLLGAVPRSFSGAPELPTVRNRPEEWQPTVARLLPEHVPHNPVDFEALDALYLNSERAMDLTPDQADALSRWIHTGGRFIVSVEQPGDLAAATWLRDLLPLNPTEFGAIRLNGELRAWLQASATTASTNSPAPRSGGARRQGARARPPIEDPWAQLQPDPAFDQATLPILTGERIDGRTLVSVGDVPLAIETRRGRGQVVLLLFNPEREPFRSWTQRSLFWARVAGLTPSTLNPNTVHRYGGRSIDALLGAMIDSTQVRKLPVTWLLALLLVYLVVIGPIDHFVLTRLGRPMLTWLTFPAYVALFSAGIYYLGYRLRAGEIEWNEMHIIDVLPRGAHTELRGRTFASIYSPISSEYRLATDRAHAVLRGEFQGAWGARADEARARVEHRPRGFRAEIFVPVWTSQLLVSEWADRVPELLTASVHHAPGQAPELHIKNSSPHPIQEARLVFSEVMYPLGALAPGEAKQLPLTPTNAIGDVGPWIHKHLGQLHLAASARQAVLGEHRPVRLPPNLDHAIAAGFASRQLEGQTQDAFFIAPSTFDLNAALQRGDGILFAWAPGAALAPQVRQFTVRRHSQFSLLRLLIPAETLAQPKA
jgi:hypothetical protein